MVPGFRWGSTGHPVLSRRSLQRFNAREVSDVQTRSIRKSDVRRNLTWYSFIIMSLLALIVLVYWPTLRTLGTYGTAYSNVGLQNYRTLLN